MDLSAEGLQVKYWTAGKIFVDLSAEEPQVKYWTTGKIFVCGFVCEGSVNFSRFTRSTFSFDNRQFSPRTQYLFGIFREKTENITFPLQYSF